MKKNILISTGGSGGHVSTCNNIFMNILKDEFNVFMTSDYRGINFLDKNRYNVKIIDMPKISKNIFLLPFQIFLILQAIFKSYFFLKKKE